jgi:hypothetical protein
MPTQYLLSLCPAYALSHNTWRKHIVLLPRSYSGFQRGVRVPPGICENILLQTETQEPPEPWTSSDPRTHEDSSPNWGAGMPETSSAISLRGQNHINNW